MRSILKSVISRDGKKKVVFFRRDDGRYGFEVFDWLDDDLGRTWNPHGYNGIFPDLETAEREARGSVEWLEEGSQ